MDSPVRILAVVPEPADAPWSATAAALWDAIESLLRQATDRGSLQIVRLNPATETAFAELAARDSFDVVHVVGRGTSRTAARYGTLTMEGSGGRLREVNAQNFAKICAQLDRLELVVVQAAGGASSDFEVLCDAVVQHAASVVSGPPTTSHADAREAAQFAATLYTALASGQTISQAFAAAARGPGLPTSGNQSMPDSAAKLRLRETLPPRTSRSASPPIEASVTPAATVEQARPPHPPAPIADAAAEARDICDRKRAAGAFDVFLCHNVGDKPAVMEIGRRLMSRGLLPWLDHWELRPGMPWQRVLEEQISNIRAAAVFVGRDGIGPWQRQELDGFLREFNTRGCPVIPVMLPGSSGEPELPLFLRGMTWVDFRAADPDPLARLIWGITGQRPDAM